jgi:hypothetical protein
MSEPQNDDKLDRKRNEKDEKGRDEKWQRDPLGAAVWAFILIWVGIALLLENAGVLDDLAFLDDKTINAWQLAFAGAGVILLLEAAVRVIVPDFRQPVVGTVILGIVFLSIGLGELVNTGVIVAVAIVLVGVILLMRGLRGSP